MAKKRDTIQTYRWAPEALIPQLDLREGARGGAVAYIYTHENEAARLPELQNLREQFKNKGWASSSDSRDGKPVLRLTGIQKPGELIALLGQDQQAAPQATAVSLESEERGGILSSLKRNTLRASGMFYTLGNSFYIMSGLSRGKDIGQIGTGLAFSSGDVLLATFGGKDDARQFKLLLKKLTRHWEKEGIEIPKESAILAETRPSESFGERAHDFLHAHINKIKALAEVVGGGFYFKAGHDQRLKGEPQGKWKMATAVIFTLGFGSTLFIKEKKPDKEKLKDAGAAEKAWAFVQEKPLRIGGWSGLSNTLFTTIGAFQERAQNPNLHHYRYDLSAAGSMLIGNNLYALSNKATGGSITSGSLVQDVYGLAAQVLNRLPEEKREAAIKTTVDFLGERTELKDSRGEVDTNLREEMYRLNHENPWFAAKTAQETGPKERQWAKAPAPDRSWEQAVKRDDTAPKTPTL